MNAIEIPGPARRVMVEAQQSLFGERLKKLDHEERIARGLLMHQLRQRRGALRLAAKRIRDQISKVFRSKRRKWDGRDLPAGILHRLKLVSQRMSGVDLVVPVGA